MASSAGGKRLSVPERHNVRNVRGHSSSWPKLERISAGYKIKFPARRKRSPSCPHATRRCSPKGFGRDSLLAQNPGGSSRGFQRHSLRPPWCLDPIDSPTLRRECPGSTSFPVPVIRTFMHSGAPSNSRINTVIICLLLVVACTLFAYEARHNQYWMSWKVSVLRNWQEVGYWTVHGMPAINPGGIHPEKAQFFTLLTERSASCPCTGRTC